jgi:hypothetical protein
MPSQNEIVVDVFYTCSVTIESYAKNLIQNWHPFCLIQLMESNSMKLVLPFLVFFSMASASYGDEAVSGGPPNSDRCSPCNPPSNSQPSDEETLRFCAYNFALGFLRNAKEQFHHTVLPEVHLGILTNDAKTSCMRKKDGTPLNIPFDESLKIINEERDRAKKIIYPE